MAFSTVLSAALLGIQAELISVEADVSNGLPMFHMVGYLSSEVKEASERVRTAVRNSGIDLPPKKMVINLSPGTVRKKGAAFDLPIAVAILASLGLIPERDLGSTLVIGELSLDGSVREVPGILPIVIEAKEKGCQTCILPEQNASEGALISGIKIVGVSHLTQLCDHLKGNKRIKPAKCSLDSQRRALKRKSPLNYSDIKGQEAVKRAVEVSVSGGHNLLLLGPPGGGKSMIASRIPGIMPPMSVEESLEITKIYSIMGMLDKDSPLIAERPFRSVHHTVTKSALVGGGVCPSPGEISLAHGGAIFLDELAEFQKPVLEVLREPLEEHCIRISRNNGNYTFPADFILIAAMNPCPCGNYPDIERCSCTPGQIRQYLNRVSQPFLDRLDICVEVPRVEYEFLNNEEEQESSDTIRERVCRARGIQHKRYHNIDATCNATLGVREIGKYCQLGDREEELMKRAFKALELTARTYHKILKTARTIADMEASEQIRIPHLKEAIGYRTIDKKYWGR